MTLSTETFHKLTKALTPEVIDYINKDERYVIFMQEIIPDALTEKMGQLEENLLFELSYSIMDSIFLNR
jgi:hypothetical protein